MHAIAQPAISTAQACQSVSASTCRVAQKLGRGINMANMLEAPMEGDWGLRLEPAYIDLVQGKFTTIRLPVRWSNHATPSADATLDDFFTARVSKAVDAMLEKDFYVILNVHHYNQLFGDKLLPKETSVDPAVLELRFVNLWRQIASHYRNRSPKLIFELLNEPHGRMNGEAWNLLAAKALAAVRESNPDRTVMIGPGNYNGIPDLAKLKLPPDRNLIVAIHNYDPFAFTHQGATWLPFKLPVGVMCCSAQQQKAVSDMFDTATAWSARSGYPLHLGEFGSLQSIDPQAREAYTRMVRDTAEAKGIAWTYWEFGSLFGVYSPEKRAWVEPIRRALLD